MLLIVAHRRSRRLSKAISFLPWPFAIPIADESGDVFAYELTRPGTNERICVMADDVRTQFGAFPIPFRETPPTIILNGLIIPEKKTNEGTLVGSISLVWTEAVLQLAKDWAR